MRVAPLTPQHPSVIRDALVQRGLSPVRADAAAAGLDPVAFVFDAVVGAEREGIARAARDHGLECLTGEGWALVAGGAAQVAGLARPGFSRMPPNVAEAMGRFLRGVVERPTTWETARGPIQLNQPKVVGVLNVTPDSFSDGGRYLEPEAALRQAARMVAEGAAILDLGAESTRPGRPDPVPVDEEWRRLGPVLEAVVREYPSVPVSIDTVKAETARRALESGAWIINDVSGLRCEPDLAEVCARFGAGLVIMHSRGTVSTMATFDHATYDDVIHEVMEEMDRSVEQAQRRDVRPGRIVLDPGLGFAKRTEHNLEVLHRLPALTSLGHPVMVGPSRKRFLGAVTGRDVDERDAATVGACVTAFTLGAALFRVHAVAPVVDALATAAAIWSA